MSPPLSWFCSSASPLSTSPGCFLTQSLRQCPPALSISSSPSNSLRVSMRDFSRLDDERLTDNGSPGGLSGSVKQPFASFNRLVGSFGLVGLVGALLKHTSCMLEALLRADRYFDHLSSAARLPRTL